MTNVKSEVTGNVWKIEVEVGQSVSKGASLIIVESMKMEIPIEAPADGTVSEIFVKEGEPVADGAVVAVLL